MQPRATGNKKSGETPGGTLIAGVRTEEGRGGSGEEEGPAALNTEGEWSREFGEVVQRRNRPAGGGGGGHVLYLLA